MTVEEIWIFESYIKDDEGGKGFNWTLGHMLYG